MPSSACAACLVFLLACDPLLLSYYCETTGDNIWEWSKRTPQRREAGRQGGRAGQDGGREGCAFAEAQLAVRQPPACIHLQHGDWRVQQQQVCSPAEFLRSTAARADRKSRGHAAQRGRRGGRRCKAPPVQAASASSFPFVECAPTSLNRSLHTPCPCPGAGWGPGASGWGEEGLRCRRRSSSLLSSVCLLPPLLPLPLPAVTAAAYTVQGFEKTPRGSYFAKERERGRGAGASVHHSHCHHFSTAPFAACPPARWPATPSPPLSFAS